MGENQYANACFYSLQSCTASSVKRGWINQSVLAVLDLLRLAQTVSVSIACASAT